MWRVLVWCVVLMVTDAPKFTDEREVAGTEAGRVGRGMRLEVVGALWRF